MTAHTDTASTPRFDVPSHRAFVRGAIVVALFATLTAGFLAQVASAPASTVTDVQASATVPCTPAS